MVMVPVLPQHISSTDPMYSGADRFLTRILSLNILLTEKARATSIVIGSPSGIQTTRITTMKTTILEILARMIEPIGLALASASVLVPSWMERAMMRQIRMKMVA